MNERRFHPGWVVVGACVAVMFGVWNPHAGFGVFLPVLAREFGWSRGAISVASSLNLLVGGVIGFAGLGFAGTDTMIMKAVSEIFGVRAIGAILGAMNIGWRGGAALGPAAAGFIYDATGSYAFAFSLASAGLAVGIVLFTVSMLPVRQRI